MSENTANDFLFGGIQADDESMSVFDKKTTTTDGIYRPLLKDAKDKKHGYHALIRFLPNLLESGKIGPSAIEKHVHYVKMNNEPGLTGYYDCKKNHESDCPLCTEYWKLKNSANAADNAKAEQLSRTTKYYSYIQVIEDEQHPELVGKILVYPYGYTIKEKINSERQGEVSGVPTNVFDLAKGKDFKLIIKEKAGYQNYDASAFKPESPIKLYNEKTEKFMPAPIKADGSIGFDGDDKKTTGVYNKIKSFLSEKTVNLKDHEANKWDEKITEKVNNVLAILSGNIEYKASQIANNTVSDTTVTSDVNNFNSEPQEADDFFDIE